MQYPRGARSLMLAIGIPAMLLRSNAAAQQPREPDARVGEWATQLGVSGTKLLQSGVFSFGPGLALGVGRRVTSRTTLVLRTEFASFGDYKNTEDTFTFPPETNPATLNEFASSKMLTVGAAIEHRTGSTARGLTLLADLSLLGYHVKAATQVVDNTTDLTVFSQHRNGWDWGPQLGLGARVGLLRVSRAAVMGIEARIRGALVRTSESWTNIRYVSAGLVVEW